VKSYRKAASVRVVAPLTVEVEFVDGTVRTIELKSMLRGAIFEPLKDPAYFARVSVDPELGVITWPNGADLSPEFLYSAGEVSSKARVDATS
jgi:hypothetical protein